MAALAVAPQRHRRRPLAHVDARLGGDHRGQLRGDLLPGLAAAGVDDAAPRVAALEAEGELAARVEVEGDAALAQFAHRLGRLLDQGLYG